MLDQPECRPDIEDTDGKTARRYADTWSTKQKYGAKLAQRERWFSLRAVWTGAVAAAGGAFCHGHII
jgi:hypothetical protein